MAAKSTPGKGSVHGIPHNGKAGRVRVSTDGSGLGGQSALAHHAARPARSTCVAASTLRPCSRTRTITRISDCSHPTRCCRARPFADALRRRGEGRDRESEQRRVTEMGGWAAHGSVAAASVLPTGRLLYFLLLSASLRLTVVCAALSVCCWLLLSSLSALLFVCSARQAHCPAAQKAKRKAKEKNKRKEKKQTRKKKGRADGLTAAAPMEGRREEKERGMKDAARMRTAISLTALRRLPLLVFASLLCCRHPPSAFTRTLSTDQPHAHSPASTKQHTPVHILPCSNTLQPWSAYSAHAHTRPRLCRCCRRFFSSLLPAPARVFLMFFA